MRFFKSQNIHHMQEIGEFLRDGIMAGVFVPIRQATTPRVQYNHSAALGLGEMQSDIMEIGGIARETRQTENGQARAFEITIIAPMQTQAVRRQSIKIRIGLGHGLNS